MSYAVTHILFPIILSAIFRDYYLKDKDKKHFPLHYVLIAGIGGVLPDIDIPLSYALNLLGFANWQIHKNPHTFFAFPSCFIFYLSCS